MRRITESANNEVAMHQEVQRAYQLVSRYVNRYHPTHVVMRGYGDFYGYKARDIGLDRDLLILIGLREKRAIGVSGMVMNFNVPVMDCTEGLVIFCMREFSVENMLSSVNSTMFLEVFQHEYLHLLDKTRASGMMDKQTDSHDPSAYYNDPAEFNARYHDLADPMLSVIHHAATEPESVKDYMALYDLSGNFQADIAHLMTKDSPIRKFVKNLLPERRRSLLRRLYRLHQHMMSTVHAHQ